MTRFILDTGIAGLYLDRKRGVFERASVEVTRGNRVGIAAPVLAELAFRAEGSPQRDRNILRLRQALDVWKLWLVDTATAFEYGRIAFELKTMGAVAPVPRISTKSGPFSRGEWLESPPGSARGY